jgi:hypothetical protein
MTNSSKHAWIIGLGLLLPACGDDGAVELGGETDGTDTESTTAPSTTLTTTASTTTDTPGETTEADTTDTTGSESADETAGEETAGEETAGEETAGEETAGEETAGEETAGEETAGEETAGEESTGTTGGEPECTQNEDCAALDDACHIGICEQGECVADPLDDETACETDPGNMCISGEVCTAGVCGGGDVVDCSHLDETCLVGVCDPQNGTCDPEPDNEGMPCDDGEACTYDDACVQGVCEGTDAPIFFETFSDNTQGWTLDEKWQIAMAVEGAPGGISGVADPGDDVTGDAAKGVAGVVISATEGEGGLSGPPGHAPRYLTSPEIDLTVLDPDAPKQLHFWRWLITNAAFFVETIDLWDGSEWVNIFTATATPQDAVAEWQEIAYDISAYTNADFRVRFGHAIPEVMPVGSAEPSWSIDDLAVGPVCNGGD